MRRFVLLIAIAFCSIGFSSPPANAGYQLVCQSSQSHQYQFRMDVDCSDAEDVKKKILRAVALIQDDPEWSYTAGLCSSAYDLISRIPARSYGPEYALNPLLMCNETLMRMQTEMDISRQRRDAASPIALGAYEKLTAMVAASVPGNAPPPVPNFIAGDWASDLDACKRFASRYQFSGPDLFTGFAATDFDMSTVAYLVVSKESVHAETGTKLIPGDLIISGFDSVSVERPDGDKITTVLSYANPSTDFARSAIYDGLVRADGLLVVKSRQVENGGGVQKVRCS